MKNKIIFSLDTSEQKTCPMAYESVARMLNGTLGQGSYKGEKETCIIVDQKHYEQVEDIAKSYNQESILIIDDNKIELNYLKQNTFEEIGKTMTVISEEQAQLELAYTMINGQYYKAT